MALSRPRTAHALPFLLLALVACDGGPTLQELNRGLPSLLTLATDTSAFDEADPQAALPVEVRVTDPYGDAVGGAAVAWTPILGGGARVQPDTTRTDAEGRTSATWTLGNAQGAYRLAISSPASGATLTVSAQVR